MPGTHRTNDKTNNLEKRFRLQGYGDMSRNNTPWQRAENGRRKGHSNAQPPNHGTKLAVFGMTAPAFAAFW